MILSGDQGPSPPSGLSLLQIASISLEGAHTHVWHNSFCRCQPRDRPLDNLALMANRACIHRSNKKYSKETIINGHRTPTHGYTFGPSAEGDAKNLISLKGSKLHTFPAAV